jgi:drug/metabolite transporter (DMT)-like permease
MKNSESMGDGTASLNLRPHFPMLSAAAASIITGTALVGTRYVVLSSDGLTIATLRYCVAAACLLPLATFFYRVRVAKADFISIAALGVLYFCIFPWCISTAMKFSTASNGAVVLACMPAVTLVLAGLRGSETFTWRKCLGVTLAIAGATIAVGNTVQGLRSGGLFGDGLMIFATFCGAVYAVYSKPFLAKYPPLIVTAIAMATGATALSTLWVWQDLPAGWPSLNYTGWLVILYIGAAGGALSFFLYAWALGRTAPTATMILLPLNPIAAVVAAVLFLNEPVSIELFFGLAFVIAGIFFVASRGHVPASKRKKAEVEHEIPLA